MGVWGMALDISEAGIVVPGTGQRGDEWTTPLPDATGVSWIVSKVNRITRRLYCIRTR